MSFLGYGRALKLNHITWEVLVFLTMCSPQIWENLIPMANLVVFSPSLGNEDKMKVNYQDYNFYNRNKILGEFEILNFNQMLETMIFITKFRCWRTKNTLIWFIDILIRRWISYFRVQNYNVWVDITWKVLISQDIRSLQIWKNLILVLKVVFCYYHP